MQRGDGRAPRLMLLGSAPLVRRRGALGFTLTELLVAVVTIGVLVGVLIPSVSSVRTRARMTLCTVALHEIGSAISAYASVSDRRLPPFAFSGYSGNLPLSGHWGGSGFADDYGGSRPDPGDFERRGTGWTNLWTLVREEIIPSGPLMCPSAGKELQDGRASYFPYTRQFSTYSLRFPLSADLFTQAPAMWEQSGFDIYGHKAGGTAHRAFVKLSEYEIVPVVRTDKRYRIDPAIACGDGVYDVAADAMLVDMFWRQGYAAGADATPTTVHPVQWSWCHGEEFNVLYGDGSVRTITDDGTIRANTNPPGGELPDDGARFGTYAERVWQYFDSAR